MKLKLSLLGILTITLLISLFFVQNKKYVKTNNSAAKLKHQSFIDKSPFQESLKLTRKERKASAKAPNKYYEQEYLLEMNPVTGQTEPEKLLALQEELQLTGYQKSTPGESGNEWVERGPNNVPGRTRAMLYDPNDTTHKRVFAGGVTGGLWVIDDIENPSSVWQRIGISENLVVSSITVDINNPNILYAGTGEPYVGAEGTGNGIWKSTDGGNSWSHIFGGSSGPTTFISDALLTVNSPSNIAADYAAIKSGGFGPDIPVAGITGDLVLANDSGATNPTEGCDSFGAPVAGKIAIIDRGSCNFTEKVKHAQDANAIGVIIIQSVAGFPFAMGGEDETITIPSVMISKADGEIIKNAMTNGTVNTTITPVSNSLPIGVLVPGKFHVNDIVTRNNNGTTEIYAAITEASYYGAVVGGELGIYKSIDGGANWTLLTLPLTADGNPHPINDLLITVDNKILAGSINSRSFTKEDDTFDGGGKVFESTDGVTFTEKFALANGNRVELAASATDSKKVYILIYGTDSTVNLYKTNAGWAVAPTVLPKPNDPSSSPANDFTSGQGWYNLGITVDPADDQKVYLAGISTFKSTDGGSSWIKSSHAYGSGTSPSVHADSHNIVMHPTDPNKGLVGNDGGVYYVSDWSTAQSNSNAMSSRGNGYNTTQFYKGAISQSVVIQQRFLGGSQDNGTNLISDPTAGVNPSIEISGADGMYCFIDKDSQYMITSIYQNAYYRHSINGLPQATIVNNQNEGAFVNPAELDDNLDILYSNASSFDSTAGAWTINLSRFTNIASTPVRTDLTDAMVTRPYTALKVSPYTTSSTTLLVGTDSGDIYKLTNANTTPTWTDLTPEPYVTPFLGSISSINFGANENEIMVTFHNYGVVNVYFSEDGGVTWQNKEGDLPDLPVKDILMNPLLNDEVILATDLGVWKTSNFKDANPHWIRSHNGMQNVKVTSFDLRTADNTVLASTYGRGFFTGKFTADSTASTDDVSKNKNSIAVYPTVSSGNFTITSTKNLDNTNIQVFNINGKRVYKSKNNISNSDTTITLNVEKGVYFMNFSRSDLKESHKIIVN